MRYKELLLAQIALSACPDGENWIHRPDTSFCYRVYERVDVSWNVAQQECAKNGADLVSFVDGAEMTWVYNQMGWNQSGSSWRYYWIGLNDLHQAGSLKWVTSYPDEVVPYKFNNFHDNIADMDSTRRCTFALFSNNLPQDYGHEGKWYKEKCEKTKGLDFVCKIDEKNVKRKCPGEFDVVKMGYDKEVCLQFHSSKKDWKTALNKCESGGATLIHIANDQEQADFDKWHSGKTSQRKDPEGTWIGMSDIESDPNQPQMEWYHNGAPVYTNWIYGEPETTQKEHPLDSCAFIDKSLVSGTTPNWSIGSCQTKKQYVCQKTIGSQCPDGWFLAPNENDGKCMQFYVSGTSHLSWYEASKTCKSMGAEMLMIESEMEQQFVTMRFSEWSRVGVTRLWLDDTDLSSRYPKPNEQCERTYRGSYEQWTKDEPRCEEDDNLCTYIGTGATVKNWASEYCSFPEAFGCQVFPGQMIHAIVKPISDYHCPDDGGEGHSKWELNPTNNACYLIGRNSIADGQDLLLNFTEAAGYCKELGYELVSIHDQGENSWLASRSAHLTGDIWIGLVMQVEAVIPSTWTDGTAVDYTNWQKDYPSNDKNKLYARMSTKSEDPKKYGKWQNQRKDDYEHYPVCMTAALPNAPNPTPKPDVTAAPHINCDPGWHFLPDPDACLWIDTHQRGWDAAEDNCRGLNGALASVNSPNRNTGLVRLGVLDPTSVGKWVM